MTTLRPLPGTSRSRCGSACQITRPKGCNIPFQCLPCRGRSILGKPRTSCLSFLLAQPKRATQTRSDRTYLAKKQPSFKTAPRRSHPGGSCQCDAYVFFVANLLTWCPILEPQLQRFRTDSTAQCKFWASCTVCIPNPRNWFSTQYPEKKEETNSVASLFFGLSCL